jgi:hypothetical protein
VPDGVAKTRATSLEEGRDRAIANTSDGTIILSVKCWR